VGDLGGGLLSKVEDPAACQRSIAGSRVEFDGDQAEASDVLFGIENYLRDRLGAKPEAYFAFIRKSDAHEMVKAYLHDGDTPTRRARAILDALRPTGFSI
jgi:hypothetical protein